MQPLDRPHVIRAWHALMERPDPDVLQALLAPGVVFRSPAVHTPQEGTDRTFSYLWAAIQVFGPGLDYWHEWHDESSAVLMFTAVVDGLTVEGVDIVRWDADDRIVEFTVMVRPYKGLQALIGAMGRKLESA
ncbi:nuclear transport factor 2 family protein [Rhodococcus artemisiae]|uniref:Nuclear transport factor 2 family protein n=1 Tax=Rhodococcus artemisiae TaxID=714159 RepID=A0ABU7L6K0_9NOCA|nr:nuclear transport factor 2 family protein [Rhodococcus artemisiae]MEE2057176.1 nuclear transport factor 2 family protein [Rhodococcus artemisiae]